MTFIDTYEAAVALAVEAHAGQVRKGTGFAYVTHPLSVAAELLVTGAPEDVVIAGVLHDVVEDTDVTVEQIRVRFGSGVSVLVSAVTKDPAAGRTYEQEITRIIDAGRNACLLKRADVMHNLHSLPPAMEWKRATYEEAVRRLSARIG